MAKTTRKPKPKPGGKPGGKGDVPTRIIEAALTLAAGRGWRRVRLADIAAEASVTLAELRAAFPSKTAILGGFIRRTDEKVLAAGEAEGSSARDRLFDVLMRRFDVLEPDRDAVAAILGDCVLDPCVSLCLGPRFLGSMAWMLEAAGLSSAGAAGAIRTKGLALVYLATLRVWLTDDSADKAKTMAALDRGLRRAETLALVFCPGAAGEADQPAKG